MSPTPSSPKPTDKRRVDDKKLLEAAIPIDAVDLDSELEDEGKPGGSAALTPLDLAPSDESMAGKTQIHHFGKATQREDEVWKRKPKVTGHGAIHMRTFFAKLRPDGIQHMDAQINDWLDKHPDYEVKFATTTVGLLQEKNAEPALFVTVWV
jgi:hypothetical protein